MLIDKEKTQIDAATERMMTWTEDLEEESVVEVEEKDEKEANVVLGRIPGEEDSLEVHVVLDVDLDLGGLVGYCGHGLRNRRHKPFGPRRQTKFLRTPTLDVRVR